MRITAIEAMKIFVPWQPSLREAMAHWRRTWNKTTVEEEDAYVVIRVHTDAGLVGLGEGGRDLEVVRQQGQAFIGKNPLEIDPYHLDPPFITAMFDLMGKALDVPVYQLFGGKHRDRVPVAYWSPYLPPEETARHAEEGRGRGFKVHKIKARPWDAVAQMRAIADAAGPEYAVRFDPNELFDLPSTTVQLDRDLEGYNVECFEDPVPRRHLEWFALLRQKCRIPIALHHSDPRTIFEAGKLGAMDFVNIGGYPLQMLKAAAVAGAAGCPVWVQIEGHCLDIVAAFSAHLGAAIPNADRPYDVLPFLREGSIVENPLEAKDGTLPVPEGPGLGVTLDEKMVAKYRVA